MKTLLTIGLGLFLMTATTSCKKCYECVQDSVLGDDTKEVCDYPGEASNRAEALEAEGYACTVK